VPGPGVLNLFSRISLDPIPKLGVFML
jgi:hypothetical protein